VEDIQILTYQTTAMNSGEADTYSMLDGRPYNMHTMLFNM